MQLRKQMAIAAVLLLPLLLVSCGQNPVSPTVDNPDAGTVKFSIKGIGNNASTTTTTASLDKTNGGFVTVTSARVVIEKIELENSTNSAFDFKFDQPFVQDLATITNLQEIQTFQIPFGTYDKIKISVDDLDAQDGLVFDQNPELQNLSMLVQGYLNDDPAQTFEFSSDITLDVKIKFDPPLEINETTVSKNIVLGIDYNTWFVDAGGNLLDPNDPGNKNQIENNIKDSFDAFEDNDNDGRKDHDSRNDEFETKGAISSLGSDFLVVSDTTFFVDANTVVEGHNDTQLSFSDLQEGMFVEVRADLQADGRWLATRIQVEDGSHDGDGDHNGDDDHGDDNDNDEFETKGAISSIGSDFLVVSDTTFFVDGNTVVEGHNDTQLSFSDLQEGMFVEVRADLQADGRWLATRIKLEDDAEHDDDDHD